MRDTTVGEMHYETPDKKLKVYPSWLNEMDDELFSAMEMTNDKVLTTNKKEMDAVKELDIIEGFIQDKVNRDKYISSRGMWDWKLKDDDRICRAFELFRSSGPRRNGRWGVSRGLLGQNGWHVI